MDPTSQSTYECVFVHISGLYCSGWVKTGPVGVILTTMNKAFETAEFIIEDFTQGTHAYIIFQKCIGM